MQNDLPSVALARHGVVAAAVTTAHVATVGGGVGSPVRGGNNQEGRYPAHQGNHGQQDPRDLHAAQEDTGANGPRHGFDRENSHLLMIRGRFKKENFRGRGQDLESPITDAAAKLTTFGSLSSQTRSREPAFRPNQA